jgi:hypothetical protein
MKAYIARHKVTKQPWKGKKVIFDCTVGLRAALEASFASSHGKGCSWQDLYDIWAYNLVDGTIERE